MRASASLDQPICRGRHSKCEPGSCASYSKCAHLPPPTPPPRPSPPSLPAGRTRVPCPLPPAFPFAFSPAHAPTPPGPHQPLLSSLPICTAAAARAASPQPHTLACAGDPARSPIPSILAQTSSSSSTSNPASLRVHSSSSPLSVRPNSCRPRLTPLGSERSAGEGAAHDESDAATASPLPPPARPTIPCVAPTFCVENVAVPLPAPPTAHWLSS